MNAEERFEKWRASYGSMSVGGEQFAKQAWLACEDARDAEIERVVAELNLLCDEPWVKPRELKAAVMVKIRSLLSAQPKEGD